MNQTTESLEQSPSETPPYESSEDTQAAAHRVLDVLARSEVARRRAHAGARTHAIAAHRAQHRHVAQQANLRNVMGAMEFGDEPRTELEREYLGHVQDAHTHDQCFQRSRRQMGVLSGLR